MASTPKRKSESVSSDLLLDALDRLLDAIGFDEDEQIRLLRREDGREVLLIQANPFSLSRMYITGRPDGKRIEGHDSFFDLVQAKLHAYREEHGTAEGFQLKPEEWGRLFGESRDRYIRYLFFSGIHRWQDVERDTRTNLAVCDLAHRHAPDELAWSVYQFKGYILMMNYIAKAELESEAGDTEKAMEQIAHGIEKIGAYCRECLLSDHPEAEAITREHYLANILKYREELLIEGRGNDREDPRNIV